MRKPVFRVSDQIRHNPGCTATDVRDFLNLDSSGIVLSITGTVQLICAFVFAWAKRRFFLDAAHSILILVSLCVIKTNFCHKISY